MRVVGGLLRITHFERNVHSTYAVRVSAFFRKNTARRVAFWTPYWRIRTVVFYGTARREVKTRLLLIIMLILTLIIVVGLVIGALTL